MAKKKFVLISVSDRAISTQTFDTLEDAQERMHEEMLESGVPEEAFVVFDGENEFACEEAFNCNHEDYEVSEMGGWANGRTDDDWLIVPVVF